MKRVLVRVALAALVAVALCLAVGITGAQTACAHDPRFACSPRSQAHPIRIHDPSKSWAFYGRLAPGERDVYAFHVERATRVPVALLVEVADKANPARPSLQILSGSRTVATMVFRHPLRFYEPFSGTDYLTTPTGSFGLPPGDYEAIVTMSDGDAPQRYVLALGSEERFGIGEIPYVFGAILRIRDRGY